MYTWTKILEKQLRATIALFEFKSKRTINTIFIYIKVSSNLKDQSLLLHS